MLDSCRTQELILKNWTDKSVLTRYSISYFPAYSSGVLPVVTLFNLVLHTSDRRASRRGI